MFNPAYRLNANHPQTPIDPNYFMQAGLQNSVKQDKEVANITQGDDNTNVVYLKDPKHIEGFGSNVVHVNVSCGQTIPDAQEKGRNSRNTTQNAKTAAPAPVEDEDDEEAQTFIIQLSEEQTKELANGTLKLNGVPIPKDLSNLSDAQILALLDSVNLPPVKGSGSNKNTTSKP